MKKAKLLTVLGVMLAMGITGCNGGKSSAAPESKPGSSAQPTTSAPAPTTSSKAPESSTPAQPKVVPDPDGHKFGNDTDVAADATAGTVAYKKAACTENDGAVRFKVNQSVVTYDKGGRKSGTPDGYTKLNANGDIMSFKFNVDQMYAGKLYLYGVMDGYSSNLSKNFCYYNGSPNVEVKVNGDVVDISAQKDVKFQDIFGTEADPDTDNLSPENYALLGNIVLKEGVNEITYKRVATLNMLIKDFVFIAKAHTHEFGEWAEAKAATYTELGSKERVCSCGLKEQKDVNTIPFNVDADSEVVKLNADGKKVNQYTYNSGAAKVAAVAVKQNSGVFATTAVEGQTEKWEIGANANKAAADTYKLDKGNALLFKINVSAAVNDAFIAIGGKYSNANPRYFYNQRDGGQGDAETEDGYRYYTKVNDGDFKPVAFNSLMSDVFGDGSKVAYMPLGKFNLKAGENLIYVRQGNIGYRVTLQDKLYVALSGDATITGDDPAPAQEIAGAYPTFKWGDAIQEDSATLDGAKFKASSTYILKVKNVPAAGTYTITLPMKGSSGNGSKTLNGTGQGFSISANDVAGTFYGEGKTYEEFFGADQGAWVDVLFGEFTLNAGTNTIKIVTTSGGYRVSLNVDTNITLAAKAAA